ncbi:MAG: arginine repressor, partial [Bifidobacteriaceae bacterium]|nr:arginine repressor [Bifidobacteriaceae bacterium]
MNKSDTSPNAATPGTKTARQRLITQLLRSQPIRSQQELADALAAQGVGVTQATLSRD